MGDVKAHWQAISAISATGLFLAAAFGGPIVLWRDLGSQITEQGSRLEAKIEAQGDRIDSLGHRLEAKIEAQGRETREFHRQMLEQIRDLYVRHSDLKERVATLEVGNGID